QGIIKFARMVVLVTWLFYPIAYLFNVVFDGGAVGQVGVQVGYSIADITAKAGFGVVIYKIAAARTAVEGETTGDMATA
ncbi:MAG: bacteriorhodopsin, partial [Planctomycetota bacterium]